MKVNKTQLQKRAIEEIKTDKDLILLTILSSLIASYGVKMDNMFVLIGAMLVSPLFDPIISLVVLSFLENEKASKKALKSLIITLLIAFGTSLIFWFIVMLFEGDPSSSSFVPEPSIDFIIVSVLLGIVGMFLWIWPKASNTSAGVAIAISLVPPITYFAMHLVNKNMDLAFMYLAALLLSLMGILVGASIVMYYFLRGKLDNTEITR